MARFGYAKQTATDWQNLKTSESSLNIAVNIIIFLLLSLRGKSVAAVIVPLILYIMVSKQNTPCKSITYKNMVKIYTKGLAEASRRIGACAFIMTNDDEEISSGSEWFTNTTCNRMSLQAIISGLSSIIGTSSNVVVVSDNNYTNTILVDDPTGYENQDLLLEAMALAKERNITIVRPSGNTDTQYMVACKELAREKLSLISETYANFEMYLKAKGSI